MTPTVDAVVPTLAVSPWLGPCLEAVRREVGDGGRIVVVYQGEGQEPERLLAPRDQWLRFPRRLGFARAVNEGLRESSAELVLLCNDDAVLQPGWLDPLTEALASDEGLAAAQGVNLGPPPGEGGVSGEGPVDGWGIGWNRWWQAVQLGTKGAPPLQSSPPREVFGVSATACLLRRSALAAGAEDGRFFDERLDTYYEDVELAVRLRRQGWQAVAVAAARAVHHGGASGGVLGAERWTLLYGNRLLVLARMLGRQWPRRQARARFRDVLDVARRPGRAPAVAAGWRRFRQLAEQYVHDGEPLGWTLRGRRRDEPDPGPHP